MSTQGEAAEQVVGMATNMTVKGVEVAVNLAGRGALSLATFLLAAIKDQKRTKGKVRMRSFENKPTKVFVIKNSDMPTFAKEAKQYGVKYAAILNKKDENGLCDVVVSAEDAARVSRIADRFALSTVDVDKIKEEIQKTRQQEPIITQEEQPSSKKVDPLKARTESSNLSEPISKSKSKTDSITRKPSVRKEIQQIRHERKTRKPQQQQQTLHRQPQLKKKKYIAKSKAR